MFNYSYFDFFFYSIINDFTPPMHAQYRKNYWRVTCFYRRNFFYFLPIHNEIKKGRKRRDLQCLIWSCEGRTQYDTLTSRQISLKFRVIWRWVEITGRLSIYIISKLFYSVYLCEKISGLIIGRSGGYVGTAPMRLKYPPRTPLATYPKSHHHVSTHDTETIQREAWFQLPGFRNKRGYNVTSAWNIRLFSSSFIFL